LEPEEADRLQAVADQHRHPWIGPLIALALGTGLRLGEMQALRWGSDGLDLERRRLAVTATRDWTGELVPPKSGRSRTVPLSDGLASRFRRYRVASPRSQEGEPVFWRSHRHAFSEVWAAIDIPKLRAHDLRHTAAMFWLAAGLSIHAVAELLGHTDATLVLRLYGHALPSEVEGAAERREAWRARQRDTGSEQGWGLPQALPHGASTDRENI
jgi:integrase